MCTIPVTDSDDPPTDTDEEVATDAPEEPPCLSSNCRYLDCADPAVLARSRTSCVLNGRIQLYQEYKDSSIKLPRPWSKNLPSIYRNQDLQRGHFPFNRYLYNIAVGDTECDCTHVILTTQHTTQRYFDWPCGCSNPVIVTTVEGILKLYNSMKESTLTDFTSKLAPTHGCIICPLQSDNTPHEMYAVPSRSNTVVVRYTKRRCTNRLSLTDRKRYKYGNNRQYT